MKRIAFLAFMMLVSITMFADKGDTWVGGQLSYGYHKDYHQWGIGGRLQYELLDDLRADGTADFFFKNKGVALWDANANLNYVFHSDDWGIYPLLGITILGVADHDLPISTELRIGCNVGAGVEYPLSDHCKVNAELKYQVVEHWNRLVLSVGVVFPL